MYEDIEPDFGGTNEPWGRPALPPENPSDNHAEILTRFNGWVESVATTQKGYLKIVLGVDAREKYKALRMTDLLAVALHFEVYQPDVDDVLGGLDQALKGMMRDDGP